MIKILFFLGVAFFANTAYAACTGPVGAVGDVIFNTTQDVLQGCTKRGWYAFHEVATPPDACAGSPTPGTVCADGSVYAGLSPDGNVAMFTTPADAPSLMTWNDGSSPAPSDDSAMVNCNNITPGTAISCQTGKSNTAFLVGLNGSGSPAPYIAAEYCNGLTMHGHTDWYLPAQDELNVLINNRVDIGGFTSDIYWSSSEHDAFFARYQNVSTQNRTSKASAYRVRCVRR